MLVQDLVLAVLVEREPIKLAPNSAQIPALLAKTKQNIYQMRQSMGPAASAAASVAQSTPEVSNASVAQAPGQQTQVQRQCFLCRMNASISLSTLGGLPAGCKIHIILQS